MQDLDKMSMSELEQWYIKAIQTMDGLKAGIEKANELITRKNDAGEELTLLKRSKSERAEIDEHLVQPCDIGMIKAIGFKKVDDNPTKYITVKEANDNGLSHIVGYKIVKPTYTKK